MTDLTKATEPKSDQLNADDLIGGTKTITITSVKVKSGDQPVSIHFEGDEGKPWKPCKSMLRLLMMAWNTKNGDDFVGKKVTLYNDPRVKWGGMEVGGIRVSHVSHIDKKISVMLTETRGKRAPYAIEPLIEKPKNKLSDEEYSALCEEMKGTNTMAELQVVLKNIKDGYFDDDGLSRLRDASKLEVERIRGCE